MIIANRSRLFLNRMFTIAKWAVVALTLALSLYYSLAIARPKPIEQIQPKVQEVLGVDGEKILSGPLGLYENKRSLLALALEQNLSLLVQNVRPDLRLGEKIFFLALKGSPVRKEIKEGEPIHFHWDDQKFDFAEEGRQMVPHIVNGSEVLLKLGDEEVILQPVQQKQGQLRKDVDNFNLLQAKWWGNDLFFREYGGDEYRELSKKYKIEMQDGRGSYFLYVKPRDYLTYHEGRWRVGEAEPEAPLAVVRAVSDREIEIEAWDPAGAPLAQMKLPLQKSQPIHFAADQVIAEPKLRSGSLVACKIGKKRLALRPNDWVIKTQTGWRKLVTINEIESYLNNEQLEELFVVDSVEQNGQLRGRHFDAMRTQMKPFTIQAAVVKGKSTKKRTAATK